MSNASLRRPDGLPFFLTPQETADLLRITRKALYVMIERRKIPGVIRRSQRRIVFDTEVCYSGSANKVRHLPLAKEQRDECTRESQSRSVR